MKMFCKKLAARILGLKSLGYANIYERHDGKLMTGSMIYPTKEVAIRRGRGLNAISDYVGTKEIFVR